jgi:hypothetical protein
MFGAKIVMLVLGIYAAIVSSASAQHILPLEKITNQAELHQTITALDIPNVLRR